ncbi:hypothetical protein PF004_g11423 [Phytophthora fragariae]|uniref:ZZ-type domain-containing protein n=1 Tax=Phytophthora fragariae TaxID=53985 RepID=A0A6G0NY72_9STRA|nr:hypothetical protein PF004_g11423 [Phytophthora fragariae]
MNLLVASLQALDVSEDAGELATIKTELLLALQDDELRKAVEELSAAEEFKELAHAMVTAIYDQDAQAIEDAATARFDELLAFAQRVVARCPALKPVVVSVAKALMAGLVRYNDDDMDGEASDSSSSSSASSCCSDDHETLDVEVFTEQVPLHLGVVCNGCKAAPLVGVRYKSLEVSHFDLCEGCEASGNYMRFEPFVKITDPSRAPKQKRTSEIVHPFATCDGCEMSPIVGVRFKSDTKEDFDLCDGCEASGKWTESHGPFSKIEDPCLATTMDTSTTASSATTMDTATTESSIDTTVSPVITTVATRSLATTTITASLATTANLVTASTAVLEASLATAHHFTTTIARSISDMANRTSTDTMATGLLPSLTTVDTTVDPLDLVLQATSVASGHRDFHHGRHTRFSDEEEDEQQQEGRCHRRRHGCGRGRWGHEEARTAQEIFDTAPRTAFATDADMEIEDAADVRAESGDGNVAITETEDKANYSETLAQLASMGFEDVEKNIRALELTDGNVGGAVNMLLSE